MTQDLIILSASLVVIIIAAEVFTNAIESLGAKLKSSEGVTGSIFAAVGTLLCQNNGPARCHLRRQFCACKRGGRRRAILGAPFMLTTLAMFLVGIASVVFLKKGEKNVIHPELYRPKARHEFFLFVFSIAFFVAFTPPTWRLCASLLH